MEKELATWIFYEDGDIYYCFDCVQKRVDEINENKEFSDDIDFDGGDLCGYYEDYAETDEDEPYQQYCCKCEKPLLTKFID